MKNIILKIQLCLLTLASIFSFGGTNNIDAYALGQNFILQRLKGISLMIPIFIFILILAVRSAQIRLLKTVFKNNQILIMYILWSLLSTLWSVNGFYSINKLIIFTLFLISASCLISQYLYFFKEDALTKLYLHFYIVTSIIAVFIFTIWAYYGMQFGRESRMIFSPYTHANQIASYLGIGFLFLLCHNNSKNTKKFTTHYNKPFLKYALYMFFLLMIFVSFSRTVFISVIFAILISYLFTKIKQYDEKKL